LKKREGNCENLPFIPNGTSFPKIIDCYPGGNRLKEIPSKKRGEAGTRKASEERRKGEETPEKEVTAHA